MRSESYRYAVESWGVGEVWLSDGRLVLHELANPGLERATGPEADVSQVSQLAGRCLGAGDPRAPALGGRSHGKQSSSEQRSRPAGGPRPRHGGVNSPGVTVALELSQAGADLAPGLCRRFAAQLGGIEVNYDDVPIDLDWCTSLQRDFALALRSVSWGEIVSYGELAERAGRPRAPRAAGSFCAQNQLSLVLPCHRVVAADGIGGYGPSGVALKRRLLALEGVIL